MRRPQAGTRHRYAPAEWALLSDLADFLVQLSRDGKLSDETVSDGKSGEIDVV